ncbi:unnamed protein product [Sphenostylis stenocarpa]|uniref:Protein HGH1 homolog n=1 Tax=Sphenostylis stenocarpa TaxID=92480 RepID=A0AA86SU71_9FABA|nr:unnamed protein product [Sphenostylis stenocarpa]
MATEMEELVSFLSSPSPQITKAAVDIVRGLTGSVEGLQSLENYSNALLPALSRLLTLPKEVSEAAAEALVNLSQNSSLAEAMVRLGLVRTTMDVMYKPECGIAQLLVMLLVNLTQLDAGVAAVLQTEDEKVHGLYVMKLVRSFCRTTHESDVEVLFFLPDDAFEHVGSILVNISKHREGRKLLLDPKRGLLKQIIRQFDSNSSLRKKGLLLKEVVNASMDDLVASSRVSGTIRNCCFEAENQLQNMLLISEFLWPALLLPVAGNKIYSEQDRSKMPLELGTALSIEREPVIDPEIRIQVLEAIYLIILQTRFGEKCVLNPSKRIIDTEKYNTASLAMLAEKRGASFAPTVSLYDDLTMPKGVGIYGRNLNIPTDAGRRAFWSVNGPRIVQIGYEDEEDPKVMEAYEQLGSLLVHSSSAEEPSSETT